MTRLLRRPEHRSSNGASIVLSQLILLLVFTFTRPLALRAQTDTVENAAQSRRHIVDATITVGAGAEAFGVTSSEVTPLAGLDFSARTDLVDLIAGFHWGFRAPATKGLSIGLRYPILERVSGEGIFVDPALLFVDKGVDSPAFETGLRIALTGRSRPYELRLAAELRRIPWTGGPAPTWIGLEAGVTFDVVREAPAELGRRDTLHAALRYIATSDELDALDKVTTDDALEAWLRSFWKQRDVKGEPAGAARSEYERRIKLASERYGSAHRMGVTTDMGRVMLLYGEPSRVETATSTLGPQRHYELWILSGRVPGYRTVAFLFVTSPTSTMSTYAGHGAYREVFSNLRSEATGPIPNDLPVSMTEFLSSLGG